ncbi:unnamed protein product [Zymoseptoria tritici ST99CH_1A5]|uniref:Very-long-chain (3R)-3-hydroxyacyl-CoA dehydratase n=2 Tax=Zymoseptoria tritici TaxID=1047171 RepID=A0A2H1FXH6_ZYMTR|nr:unnamed protein product [Zymoseptoria tritici ST99CH_1E4]SMY21183.1 unnamed protein product [Zymoseptoria tritici ST99CH_1A5]
MNRPADSQQLPKGQATRSAKKSSPAKTGYLILYNALSAVLWAVVLTRTLQTTATKGYKSTYLEVGEWTKWTQTLAGLEVLHAATGLVRAPLLTTLMQVASRYLLVWLIVEPFPHTTALSSPAYSSMLVAWSVTEVIRYSYFAVTLTTGGVPGWMLWLRYNTFFVLYPLGIGSECWLVWRALNPARAYNPLFEWALKAILLIYVPGSYVLFTHMMAQRRKVMRAEKTKTK